MATPLTAQRFELLARAAKIAFVPHDGWQSRNRGSRGTGWGPVNGVMLHHTVTSDLDSTIRIVKDTGQGPAVPAPLYAGVIDELGRLHMVGWGRCNHAGLGDGNVLKAVIAEDTHLPAPQRSDTDGNSRFYGFAFINLGNGKDPYSKAQLETGVKLSALICKHHGWNQYSVIGHREWQRGKIDPHGPQGFLMPSIRTSVGAQLRKK